MTVYGRQIETAKRLIKAKGQLCTWRVNRDATPVDSAQPWKPSGNVSPPVEYGKIPIVFLPYTRENMQFVKALSSAPEVKIGNMYGLMASVDFDPSDKDTIIRDGREVRINYIDELAPDGTPILYIIDLID